MPPGNRPAVLFVDDDPGMLSLAHLLLGADYALQTVQSRAAAEAAIGRTEVHVLVVDLYLPDGSGLDVLERARRQQPDVEGILMTGHSTIETVTSAVEMGLHAYLPKPFDNAELERMVRTASEKSLFRRRLREKNEALERAHADLSAAYDQLRAAQQAQIEHERLASIGMIAAGIAHEINNPAAFVAANIELLEERVRGIHRLTTEGRADDDRRAKADALLTEILEMRGDATEGVSRIVSITRDLKTFGRREDLPQVTDVNTVIASVVRICGHHVRRYARLDEELGQVPPVRASPQGLNQVFLNLLVNAAQACQARGGEDLWIRLRSFASDRGVHIEVRDNAGGIPANIAERIWEPFFTTKPKGVGTGLGLSIVRRLVADHGGDIRLHTAVGEGTAFVVTLPPHAEEAPVVVDRQVPEPAPRLPRGRRILVVDDEVGIQRALRSALAPEFDVMVASDGHAALQALQGNRPDLILSDIYMAPMDGVELFSTATATDSTLTSRFLFMSGSPNLGRSLPQTVCHGVLLKPFTIGELRRAIDAAFAMIDARVPAPEAGGA